MDRNDRRPVVQQRVFSPEHFVDVGALHVTRRFVEKLVLKRERPRRRPTKRVH